MTVLLAVLLSAVSVGSAPTPAFATPLEAATRLAVEGHRVRYGLPASATLGLAQAVGTWRGGVLRFQQELAGVPVQDAVLAVVLDAQGHIDRVASSLVSDSGALTTFTTTPAQALRTAAAAVEGSTLKPDGTPWGGTARRFFKVGEVLHAGYLVRLIHVRPSDNWYAGIDATDGSVLFTQNRVRRADTAQVYASSPGGLGAGVGVTPTVSATLPFLPAGRDAGYLSGDYLTAWNCCPAAGCVEGGPSARSTGTFQTFNGTLDYDVAICDRLQRATNDPALHPSGDYTYTPVDPPRSGTVTQADPADSDPFAEVHAYFHVNNVYAYVRSLSAGGPLNLPPFLLRDVARGKKPAVWTNVSDPDFASASQTAAGLVSNALARTDNAAFLPLESMDAVSVPEYAMDVDTLLIYQGDKADFGYDAPVLWHEFGHGVIYSSANFSHAVRLDALSASDVGGALHEGIADFIAASFGNQSAVGQYVGPRTGSGLAIRDISEPLTCPASIEGESHQDGRHFAGALWAARTRLQGSDQGRTFDKAFFAALVSLTPTTTFDQAATAVIAEVAKAFPGDSNVGSTLTTLFKSRGALECSRVLDVSDLATPRGYYYLPGSTDVGTADGSLTPGPYQFKIHAAAGAKSLTVKGASQGFGGPPGSTPVARFSVLAKVGDPVIFTKAGTALTQDSTASVVPTLSGQDFSGTVAIDVPCGGDVYFTIVNTSRRPRLVAELTFAVESADSCPVVDPPPPPPPPPAEPVEGAGAGLHPREGDAPGLRLHQRRGRPRRRGSPVRGPAPPPLVGGPRAAVRPAPQDPKRAKVPRTRPHRVGLPAVHSPP